MIDDYTPLLAVLVQEAAAAENTVLDDERAVALSFYKGEPFGDEEDGRSQIVTRDVAECVDQMVISILRMFVSGDRVVEFEAKSKDGDEEKPAQPAPQAPPQPGQPLQQPQTPQQPATKVNTAQERADEATEAITYQFMRGQNGYQILHDSIKAGLLEKTGFIKTYAEQQASSTEVFEVPAVAYAMMVQEQAPVISAEPIDEAGDTWRVVVETPGEIVFRDEAVPNEEVRVSQDARMMFDAVYVCHLQPKSLSQLREMGFDFDDASLWADTTASVSLSDARTANGAINYDRNSQRTGVNRRVWLREEYILYDMNGDGIAERLCVHRVGNTILTDMQTGKLSITPVDDQPLETWSPFPMQHRLVGDSLADKTMDIQRARSVTLRQAFDAMYQSTSGRWWMDESTIGENTVDDMLTVRPNQIVRGKGMAPTSLVQAFDMSQSLNMIELMTGERESRTGITRHNQGLNPDTLNKTVGGMAMMQQAGQQVEEYMARNFAEMFARIMAKKLRLMKAYGKPFDIIVGQQTRTVNPADWPEDFDVTIRVGLGTGNKDKRIAGRLQVLNMQKEAMLNKTRLCDEEKLYKTFTGLVADWGLGNVNDYFNDPATLPSAPPAPPPMDPKVIVAQGKVQNDAAKIAVHAETTKRHTDITEMKAMTDAQLKKAAQDADDQLATSKAEAQDLRAMQAQDRAQALAIRKQDFEAELALRQQALQEQRADDKVESFRPGGALNA